MISLVAKRRTVGVNEVPTFGSCHLGDEKNHVLKTRYLGRYAKIKITLKGARHHVNTQLCAGFCVIPLRTITLVLQALGLPR